MEEVKTAEQKILIHLFGYPKFPRNLTSGERLLVDKFLEYESSENKALREALEEAKKSIRELLYWRQNEGDKAVIKIAQQEVERLIELSSLTPKI